MEEGTQLSDGRYVLEREIQAGGHSKIWEGRSLALNSPVALKLVKTLKSDWKLLQSRRALMENEKRIWPMFAGHEYVVPLHDFIDETLTIDSEEYVVLGFVMDLASEGDLRTWLSAHPQWFPKNKKALIDFLSHITDALFFAHTNSVIHCDIKPENILVFSRGDTPVPKLMDFGISVCKELADHQAHQGGTMEYMSKELFSGEQANEASDIYALGILFFEVCFGEKPFLFRDYRRRSDSVWKYYEEIHHEGNFILDASERSSLPDRLKQLIRKMFVTREVKGLRVVLKELESIGEDLVYDARNTEIESTFPLRSRLRWSPFLHDLLGSKLYYLLVKGSNPERDVEVLCNLLKECHLKNFCFYKVIGGSDYIIRIWANPSFESEIEVSLSYFQRRHSGRGSRIIRFDIVHVFDGRLMAPFGERFADKDSAIAHIAEIVRSPEDNPEAMIASLKDDQLAISVIEGGKSSRLRFFSLVQIENPDGQAAKGKQLTDIMDLLSTPLRSTKKVKNLSVNGSSSSGSIMITFTLSNFSYLGAIFSDLLKIADGLLEGWGSKILFESFVMVPGGDERRNDDGAVPFLVSQYLDARSG